MSSWPARRRRPGVSAALVALVMVLAGCTDPSESSAVDRGPAGDGGAAPGRGRPAAPAPPPTAPPRLAARGSPRLSKARVRLERIVRLEEPTALAVRAGEAALYVAERDGHIRRLVEGRRPRLVVDLSKRVLAGGERGLLGLVFDPAGQHLYVSYIGRDADSHVDVYDIRHGRIDRASRRRVLKVEQPDSAGATVHKGGNLVFGPDGMLYLGLGDGGPSAEPPDTSQATHTLLGKLVRIDPTPRRRRRPYRVPRDNPLVGRPGTPPELYALGLRNPWRFSFDRATGDLWLGDVGRYVIEEINRVPVGELAGANFGWDLLEGSRRLRGTPPKGHVAPVHEYNHDDGRCALIGGYVYRGRAIPSLHGAFVYGDYCDGKLRALVRRRRDVRTTELGVAVEALSSFGEGLDGELYVLSLTRGVYRLLPGR